LVTEPFDLDVEKMMKAAAKEAKAVKDTSVGTSGDTDKAAKTPLIQKQLWQLTCYMLESGKDRK
jgi:hypothetical protein